MTQEEQGDPGRRWRRRLLVLPPLAIGAALLAAALLGSAPPETVADGEPALAVRVIRATAVDVVPRAVAYGTVLPAETWTAVAQVSGRVVERHPNLEPGSVLAADAVLLHIDETDYRLAQAQLAAAVARHEAELAELAVRQGNVEQSLEIEERALALAEQDLDRKRQLAGQGTISQATLDEAEQTTLATRQRVQDLRNQIALLPAERAVIEAAMAVDQAQLRQAEIDLERTVIRLPFDARVAEAPVEIGEFVQLGQTLAVADGIARAEVTGRLAPGRLRPVFAGIDLELGQLSAAELTGLPDRLAVEAQVRLTLDDRVVTWPARFARIREAVDPTTRTIGIVVGVDDPFRQAQSGVRPPLTKNMFVEIVLTGPPVAGRIVVPRNALVATVPSSPATAAADGASGANHAVLLAGPEDRLVVRPVTVAWQQDDLAVLAGGLADGDLVVISDVSPAIGGMALDPVVDEATLGRLLSAATAGLDAP